MARSQRTDHVASAAVEKKNGAKRKVGQKTVDGIKKKNAGKKALRTSAREKKKDVGQDIKEESAFGDEKIRDILDNARGVKKTTRRKTAGRKRSKAALEKVGAEIEAVLLQLMAESNSDSVRVSAAKALMDKIKGYDGADDDGQERYDEERRTAIAEARRLLDELALAKRCRDDGALALDQGGKTGPVDSAG